MKWLFGKHIVMYEIISEFGFADCVVCHCRLVLVPCITVSNCFQNTMN